MSDADPTPVDWTDLDEEDAVVVLVALGQSEDQAHQVYAFAHGENVACESVLPNTTDELA